MSDRFLLLIISFFLFFSINFHAFSQKIDSVYVKQNYSCTGCGNNYEVILMSTIYVSISNSDTVSIKYLTMNMLGTTDINDVDSISFFSTCDTDFFDERNANNAICIGTCFPSKGNIICNIKGIFHNGVNYLWIIYSISSQATEGHFVDASIVNIATDSQVYSFANGSPAGSRQILLKRKLIFSQNDYESKNYRIPAIIVSQDGSLVLATDKRKNGKNDLPADIDVLSNRSVDSGTTWSSPVTVALGTGVDNGFGDAALVLTNDENGLILVCVGGRGLMQSTPDNPIRSYMFKSYDNGITWSTPTDITHYIYGVDCKDKVHQNWYASFFASGNGLLTSTGRIIFVAAVRESYKSQLNNYAVYSDDNGLTWNVSERASIGGDEAKVVELSDGSILMSIRSAGYRLYNISYDGGITWQDTTSSWKDLVSTPCNGDIIRYSSFKKGDDRNRLLHSLPDCQTSRRNVSVYVSYDEGKTWPIKKCICPYCSGYSSLCVLHDGTIGFYVEEDIDENDSTKMYFMNFSMDWLTDGADHAILKKTINK